MDITREELQGIFSRVLEKLAAERVDRVSLKTDFYRFIPSDKWGELGSPVIETGSLRDDIHSLRLLLSDKSRPCTYVDFDRLASLLHAISQEINPP